MAIHQLEHNETFNTEQKGSLVVVSDNVRTPENIGMMLRISESFGVERVFFCGESPDLSNKKVKRTSRSTEQNVEVKFYAETDEAIEQLKAEGYYLVALELTTKSVEIRQMSFSNHPKIALFIGSERHGISNDVLNELDAFVYIPMRGLNSSINVVNALSIALYEVSNQMDTAGN